MTAATKAPVIRVERFDHSVTGDSDLVASRLRGTRVMAVATEDPETGVAACFPDVWIDDAGRVEIDEYHLPAAEALAWLRAVADHLEARMDAS